MREDLERERVGEEAVTSTQDGRRKTITTTATAITITMGHKIIGTNYTTEISFCISFSSSSDQSLSVSLSVYKVDNLLLLRLQLLLWLMMDSVILVWFVFCDIRSVFSLFFWRWGWENEPIKQSAFECRMSFFSLWYVGKI